jgi:hypothetical protein
VVKDRRSTRLTKEPGSEPHRKKEASESKRRRRAPSLDNNSGQESCQRKKRRTNSSEKAEKERALRAALPSEAASRLSEELTGPEQRALRAGLPSKATQRLSEDLRTNERRATEVAFRSDPVKKEREVRRTKARPKQDLAKIPAKEATRASLDLGSPGRVGRPDVEAKSEVEETNKKERDGLTKAAEQRNLKRVSKADAIDQRLLSKRLPVTVNEFLPDVVAAPDNSFVPQPGSCRQSKKQRHQTCQHH